MPLESFSDWSCILWERFICIPVPFKINLSPDKLKTGRKLQVFSWGRGKTWITPVLITTCHWFLWEKEYNSDSGLEDSGAAMMYFILTDSQIPWTMADRLIWHLLHVYYSNQVLPWSGRATEASLYWFYNGITSTFSPSLSTTRID